MVWLLVLGLLVVCLVFVFEYNRARNLSTPPRIPLVGHVFGIVKRQTDLHLQLEEWRERYGPVYQLFLFHKRVIIIGDAKAARQVLTQRPSNFRRFSPIEAGAKEVGFHGVFSVEGSEWKRQRKLISPVFTPIQVNYHASAIALVASRLRNKWMESLRGSPNGVEIDALHDLMGFTLDVIALIAFGFDLNSIEKYSEFVDALLLFMPMMQRRITAIFPYWKFFHLPIDRKFAHAQKVVHKLVADMINDYYQQSDGAGKNTAQKSFISTILEARETSNDQMEDNEIFGNAITMLLAGQDTTANTLAWAMQILSHDLPLQQELFTEVSSQPRDAEYTFLPENCNSAQLPLCSNVVQETLRLKGPAPLIYIESNKDNTLQTDEGIRIDVRKGEYLILLTRGILTDDRNFTDAKEFRPSRWAEERTSGNFLQQLPFGGGPRICPGKNLSILEANIFLSMLLNDFIVMPSETKQNSSPSELLAFTMGPNELKLRIRAR